MASDSLDRAANALVADVLANNVHRVERRLVEEKLPWEKVISYDIALSPLLSAELKDNTTLPKLISFDIHTLSIWHLAALFGYTDMLVNFLDKDIPIDLATTSGATALHLASFGGHCSTVRVLTYVYHANINCTDKYDWSALHYAASGGNIDVVQMLIDEGCDFRQRDKDGTTAAFRAEVEGHRNVAKLLVGVGGQDLLEVHEPNSPVCLSGTDTQATVFQFENVTSDNNDSLAGSSSSKWENVDGSDRNDGDAKHLVRQVSSPEFGVEKKVRETPVRSQTLPAKDNKVTRHKSIRRLIRQQLEEAFSEDTLYEEPLGSVDSKSKKQENTQLSGVNFGLETLKGILKDEILNYKMEIESQKSKRIYEPIDDYVDNKTRMTRRSNSLSAYNFDDLDEPPYEMAPPPPHIRSTKLSTEPPNVPPPLPPRKLSMPSIQLAGVESSTNVSNDRTVLHSVIKFLAHRLGVKWRALALALKIHQKKSKSEEHVQAIIKQFPDDTEKQAEVAMTEWMFNRGQSASVDDLVIALRSCGLHTLVKDVQIYTQEFTA